MAAAALGAGSLLAMIVIEVGLRVFNPIHVPLRAYDIALPVNQRFEVHIEGSQKIDAIQVVHHNSLGLRGPDAPEDFDGHTTMIMVGGSTTASGGLTESHAWPHLVYESLHARNPKFWLNNAGMNGHSTFGHLMLLRQYLVKLKPDYIVYLIGVNDVGRDDLNSFDRSIDPRQRDRAAFLIRYSELLSTAQVVWRTLRATRKGLGINGEVDFAHAGVLPRDPPEEQRSVTEHRQNFVRGYSDRLRGLVEETIAAGIAPILVTQPAFYGEGTDPSTGREIGSLNVWGTRSSLRWELLELYNDQTRAVAREWNLTLIDLARTLPKDSRFYIDYIHYSIEGAAEVARQVTAQLSKTECCTSGAAL